MSKSSHWPSSKYLFTEEVLPFLGERRGSGRWRSGKAGGKGVTMKQIKKPTENRAGGMHEYGRQQGEMAAMGWEGLLSSLEQLELLGTGIVWHQAGEQPSSNPAAGDWVQSGSRDCTVCAAPPFQEQPARSPAPRVGERHRRVQRECKRGRSTCGRGVCSLAHSDAFVCGFRMSCASLLGGAILLL